MSNKSKDQVQATTEGAPAEDPAPPPAAPDVVDQDANPAVQPDPVPPSEMFGRALVDLPQHGLRCGEYGSLPSAAATSLEGMFDTKAPPPEA